MDWTTKHCLCSPGTGTTCASRQAQEGIGEGDIRSSTTRPSRTFSFWFLLSFVFIAPLLKSHRRVEHAFQLVHYVHLVLRVFVVVRGRKEGGGRGGVGR